MEFIQQIYSLYQKNQQAEHLLTPIIEEFNDTDFLTLNIYDIYQKIPKDNRELLVGIEKEHICFYATTYTTDIFSGVWKIPIDYIKDKEQWINHIEQEKLFRGETEKKVLKEELKQLKEYFEDKINN